MQSTRQAPGTAGRRPHGHHRYPFQGSWEPRYKRLSRTTPRHPVRGRLVRVQPRPRPGVNPWIQAAGFKRPPGRPRSTSGVAFQYEVGAALATAAGLGLLGILVRLFLQTRNTSRELPHLRIFQEVDRLGRAILALGIGNVGGVFLLLPTLLAFDLPGVLYVGAGLPFFVLFVCGLVSLLRVFRFPREERA